MMKIGVQAWFWDQPHTGISVHTRGLVEALQREHEVKLVTPEMVKPWAWLPRSLRKWVWERFQAPKALSEMDIDWEYYPYPTPLPRTSNHRRAMTVHDRIAWDDPRYQNGWLKHVYHRWAEAALQRVDIVFAVSKTVQAQFSHVKAVELPNGTSMKPRSIQPSAEKTPRILIYMGGYDIRKRVPQLVDAFTRGTDADYELWLLGMPHHQSRFYPELAPADRVIQKGTVSDEEYRVLLSQAFAFVHASDSEGFNLALLEAMASGVPAIVSDIPVHHEVSGERALFWNPEQSETFREALSTLEDPKNYQERVDRALWVASRYTWENTAQIFTHATLSRSTSERKN